MEAYVSLGSHGGYAQEQLTIYASGAPTFSERESGEKRGEMGGEGEMRKNKGGGGRSVRKE